MKLDSKELAAVHAAGVRTDIAYPQLRLSAQYQARRPAETTRDSELLELKAQIRAVGGLLHNLVVVAMPDGCYEVCAGGRRLAAVGLLIEEGVFPGDYAVPCLVIPAEHAHHASFIENVARKAMHPADVYASYARLRAEGWTVEAIAAAHGANEKAVKKLLALGGVSPSLMDLFRQGKIDLDEMQALASVSDHTRQEAAWKAAKQGYCYRPGRIRELLAETEIRGDSAAARYVTVAAYEKAGGAVRRDLFQDEAYLDDPEKVHDMALEKMKRSKLAKAVAGEGWGWIDYQLSFDHNERKRFGEIQRTQQEPDKAQVKQLASLTKKRDEAQAKIREIMQGDDQDEAQLAKLRASIKSWQGQIMEIRDTLYDYPADLKPLAGVMLHLDYHGDLTATRGLIRQEDRKAVAAQIRSAAQGEGRDAAAVDLPPVKTRPMHSEALTSRLQAQRVIALQAEIIQRPNLALCLLIEQLLAEVGDPMDQAYATHSFDLSATSAHSDLKRVDAAMESASAWETVQKEMELHTRDVPGNRNDVLPWLLERAQADNIGLLAALLSATVYRVRGYNHSPDTRHLDRLAEVVGLDMAKWWSPTAQSYLSHVSKDRIAAVVAEVVGEGEVKPLLAMKKGDAAAAAEQLLVGKGWVPEILRTCTVPSAGQAADDCDEQEEA